MLHHIQKAILDKLSVTEKLRYGLLKPPELDGNVFGYHLKQLIADRYITKLTNGDYSLTSKGRNYIVHRYENPAESAHTILLIVVIKNGQYLLRRRKIQPLLGMSGFVHGEPTPNESILESANKRLIAKTGLNVKLKVAAHALITQNKNGELQSYSHAVILSGDTDEDITVHEDATGSNYWASASELDGVTTIPSCKDIVGLIERGDPWLECVYNLV